MVHNPTSSEGGNSSFQNNVPDPLTSGKELPTFKFELERSEGRVMGGSYGKEATVVQLPISKALAGVSMRMLICVGALVLLGVGLDGTRDGLMLVMLALAVFGCGQGRRASPEKPEDS